MAKEATRVEKLPRQGPYTVLLGEHVTHQILDCEQIRQKNTELSKEPDAFDSLIDRLLNRVL